MIYVTGDTHGSHRKWEEQIENILMPGDTVIVCGDFGIGFWGDCCYTENDFLDRVAEKEYLLLFIDGNHENFDKLESYPEETWNGGRIHRLRRNILHLMRGEVYDIEGKRLFAFGGGYSLDRYMRREHESWWPRELPSAAEYEHGDERLQSCGSRVDFILTHTAPSETVAYLATIGDFAIKSNVPEEFQLTAYLDSIRERVSYERWYFGHFHVDAVLWRNQTAIYNSLRELESGKVVRSWQQYEG